MSTKAPRLCRTCKHCISVTPYAGDPAQPFCNSEETKELKHPIGFLAWDATECAFYSAGLPTEKLLKRREESEGSLETKVVKVTAAGLTIVTCVKMIVDKLVGLFP